MKNIDLKPNLKNYFLGIFVLFICHSTLAQEIDPVKQYIQSHETAKAKTLLLKGLSSNSLTGDRIYLLNKIYLNEQKYDSALLVLNKLNPAVEEQRLLKVAGQAIINISRSQKTDVALTLVKELKSFKSSNSALVKLEAAFALAQIDRKEDAWDLIEQACNLKTNSPETFVSAGDLYVRLGDLLKDNTLYGKACGRYEQALLVNSGYLPALTALSSAYINSRSFNEARQKLQNALEIDSTWLPALQLMGELQYDLGNYNLASKHYSQYIGRIRPGKAQLQKYAYILYFNQEYAKAQSIINTLLTTDPDNRVLLRLLAYTSCELKQPVEGLNAMLKFMNLGKSDSMRVLASDHEYYGRLLAMNSKDSLAIDEYMAAIKMDSSKVSNYEYLAKSYEKLEKYDEAIKAYTEIIRKDKECSAIIYFSKGRNCLLLAESPEIKQDTLQYNSVINEAVTSFTRVTEMSPNSHLGFVWRGRALAALDPESTKGLARESYESAITILEAKNQNEKYKSELVESYSYMGYLNYLGYESKIKVNKEAAEADKSSSLTYWNKILELDSNNQAAIQAVKTLK